MKNKLLFVKILGFCFVLAALLTSSCADKPDIAVADSLEAAGQFQQALDLLKQGQFAGGMTAIEKKRIKTRIDRLERQLFFTTLAAAVDRKDWQSARSIADSLGKKVGRQAGLKPEPYQFDYFYYRSSIDSLDMGIEFWKQDLEKALTFYTPDIEKIQRIYEKLAFYHAGLGEYKKGREHLDKAMRKMRLTRMDSTFKSVYRSYMEGHFLQAEKQLGSIEDSLKNRGWLVVQRFIRQYGDKLTMEDRFKLW